MKNYVTMLLMAAVLSAAHTANGQGSLDNASEGCVVSNSGTWTSVEMTEIGRSHFRHRTTHAFSIPDVIPTTAREVLVYAYFEDGYSSPDQVTHFKVYTEEVTTKYIKYISIHSYSGYSWAYNSDNMWFPLTSNRRVYIEVPKVTTENVGGYIYVTGYR